MICTIVEDAQKLEKLFQVLRQTVQFRIEPKRQWLIRLTGCILYLKTIYICINIKKDPYYNILSVAIKPTLSAVQTKAFFSQFESKAARKREYVTFVTPKGNSRNCSIIRAVVECEKGRGIYYNFFIRRLLYYSKVDAFGRWVFFLARAALADNRKKGRRRRPVCRQIKDWQPMSSGGKMRLNLNCTYFSRFLSLMCVWLCYMASLCWIIQKSRQAFCPLLWYSGLEERLYTKQLLDEAPPGPKGVTFRKLWL